MSRQEAPKSRCVNAALPACRRPAISSNLILEALMLVCFGVAWLLANLRRLRSCNAQGMGAAFTAIILGAL